MSPIRFMTVSAIASMLLLTWPDGVRQDSEVFQPRTIALGESANNYRVFVPRGWSSKKKWPVILFLHGAGERGADNIAQTRVGIGPALVQQRESFQAVVVMPQCPTARWWTEPEMQDRAMKTLDQTVKELNGDPQRTYLTGLSMGGYGSWLVATNNPDRFAAIAVVCGGVRPPPMLRVPEAKNALASVADPYGAIAAKVGRTPVWVFHGDADPVVPVAESRSMVEALKATGGNVRYNEYAGVGHNSWDKAYAEPELFTWMLSRRRK